MRRKDREVTNLNEIRDILNECKTCHLAMIDNGKPYVIPLSYAYILDNDILTVYFHSAKEGRKIDILHNNNEVCFEMSMEGEPIYAKETPCNSGYYYSSVLANGHVTFVEDIKEKCDALTLLMKHQADIDVTFTKEQTDTVCIYKVETTDFSGKRKPKN